MTDEQYVKAVALRQKKEDLKLQIKAVSAIKHRITDSWWEGFSIPYDAMSPEEIIEIRSLAVYNLEQKLDSIQNEYENL